MKTLSDYYKKTLGISLNGKSPSVSVQEMQKPSTQAGPFCFLCDENDFEENRDLVLKILKAANASSEIVIFDSAKAGLFKEVFSFGLKKENPLDFESFSEISRNAELKKKLWGELKKRS